MIRLGFTEADLLAQAEREQQKANNLRRLARKHDEKAKRYRKMADEAKIAPDGVLIVDADVKKT